MNESFKLTYATMFNPPEELHMHFDEALAQLKAGLGKDYGMLIGGKDRFTSEKIEDRSPANTDMMLGLFQKGGAQDAVDALAAARKAFPVWSRMKWQDRVATMRKAANLIRRAHFHHLGSTLAGGGQEPHGISRGCAGDGRPDQLLLRRDGTE